uniref:Uncharacterized protein n=1 Tax=Chromera velia CCMP2878 TaxID=1169474 RepID=A0A0G4HXI7_9ALVE|eukprot:Cvel_33123.t1-p1 / transcript=Cvel_33123.t1 / gene=Cvel_33123 / organism=Chromera_velia_CCMP2878 / gene_product=Protein-lysine methyltransferase METTL21A, putative / transcript_product=Protein-lysine methyltransferase METTL21A, putative / location=Cvel_scaffold5300:2561-3271(-) / protein_length=237 / sequence_SO=supercontig / SO=protein_coding / is_pseudo=false
MEFVTPLEFWETECEEKKFEFTFKEKKGEEVRVSQSFSGWRQGGCTLVWSHALFQFLSVGGRVSLLKVKRLMELGGGGGLGGLVASHFAEEVVISDGDESECSLARLNVRNHVPEERRVSVAHVSWGIENEEKWKSEGLERESFDLILGNEICYVIASLPKLAETLDYSLKPGGLALLANSFVAPTTSQTQMRRVLFEELQRRGMEIEVVEGRQFEATVETSFGLQVVKPKSRGLPG